MDSCIVDSNIFIALYLSSDSQHQKALKIFAKLTDTPKIINSFIAAEVATVVLARTKDIAKARDISQFLFFAKNSDLKNIVISEQLLQATWKIFSQQQSGKHSFADCSLIATAQLLKKNKIATFDQSLKKEFATKFTFI